MSKSHFWNLLAKKFAGEASAEELAQLEQYLRDNPNWAYAADYFQKLWKPSSEHADPLSSELAFEEHLDKLKLKGVLVGDENEQSLYPFSNHKVSFFKRYRWALAAAAFILLLSGFYIFSGNHKNADDDKESFSAIYTRAGSKTKLVLPDSTVVWLNAGSKLTYSKNFGISNRNTTLTGEAFFDVKKSSIPFIIHCKEVHIKVLGTAFNVKSYPGEKTETSLLRGKVEITFDKRPGEKFLLKPNEKLTVASEQVAHNREPFVVLSPLVAAEDETIPETSWVDNKLVFQDESLAELAVKMERWYGVNIEITDEVLAAERLSGSFTTETVQEALDVLKLTTHLKYSIKSNLITISKL